METPIDPSQLNLEQRKALSRKLVRLPALIVLIGIAIAATVYGGMWLWQKESTTSDPTTNWQTYRSEEYGFEFRYPTTWSVNNQSFTYNNQKTAAVEISSPVIYSLPGYEHRGAHYSLSLSFTNEISVQDQGFVAEKLSGDQAVTNIDLHEEDLKKTEEYKITQNIIKSAKRVSTNIETSDWKTYSTELGGFEFKYPVNYSVNNKSKTNVAPFISSDYVDIIIMNLDGKLGDITILVDGKEFFRDPMSGNRDGGIDYSFDIPSKNLTILFSGKNKKSYNHIDEYDKIISTFSFFDKLIYKNTEYGFEFKYPADWQVEDLTFGAKHDENILKFFGAGPVSQPEDTIMNVIIYKNPLEAEILRQKNIISSNPNQELISTEQVDLLGLIGKKITVRNKYSGALYSTYYFFKNNLTYSVNDIQTFKFIEPEFCIQVITPARNSMTGEVRDFPTPCDVPEGWEKI